MKHKHCDVIKAWADGAEIQFRWDDGDEWKSILAGVNWYENCQYRVKPEPKPDVVRYVPIDEIETNKWLSFNCIQTELNGKMITQLKLNFDGETGKLKSAEVLK
jgi:hypothetical protein